MTTAFGMVIKALEKSADSPSVERRGKWLSGTQILHRIQAKAAELPGSGLRSGDTALIVVSDNLLAMETLIACWILGITGAFVDFRTPAESIAELATHLGANRIIGCRPVDGLDIWVSGDACSTFQSQTVSKDVKATSKAIIFMSSGTTGPAMVSPRTQGQLGGVLADFCATADPSPHGCMLSATSVAYSASCFHWLQTLATGQPIVALDLLYRLEELDVALQRPDVGKCGLPPVLIRRLTALADPVGPVRYPQLAMLSSVGGPASAQDKIAAVTRLSPNYRMNYSCVGIGRVSRISGAEIMAKPASCGKVQPGVRVTILDGQRICGPNEIGEISIATDSEVAKRPGDLGWMDEDGYLYITGRVQGMFCRNGINFSADQLVSAALDLPEIDAAAAISDPNHENGDVVHLYVQCKNGSSEKISRHLKRALPAAQQPDHIHLRDVLPTNVAGKIIIQKLVAEVEKQQRTELSDAS